MVSVIIPARNEKYLAKTIRNILNNARGEIEVIAILDGYLPDPQIHMRDNRVRFVHYEKSVGQRAAINEGARQAKGKYIFKLDGHSAVDEGFDVKLAADCEYNWTVIPRMYNLDIETWKPKLHKRTDYMYIGQEGDRLFRAEYYTGQARRIVHSKTEEIDDVMCCMGPGWFMHKDRFWELGGMDEGHGGWGQMGVEVACKAWLSGGRLVVNKKTWFSHWFRGNVGFPYRISSKDVSKARAHSRALWGNDKWDKQVRKYQWLVDKFIKPQGEQVREPDDYPKEANLKELFRTNYYHIVKKRNFGKWRGTPFFKFPSDVVLLQEAIYENKPDFIVETGTRFGGTTKFLADMCRLVGNGKVITVDISSKHQPKDDLITYIVGSSIHQDVVDKITKMVGVGTVMIILDSNHSRRHVKWELHKYSKLVTPGQYLIVEDCYSKNWNPAGPMEAKEWFLKRTHKFKEVDVMKKFYVGLTMGGWLKRI